VKQPSGYCLYCRKSFNNQRAYANHVNSKKCKDQKAKFQKREDKMDVANNRLNRKPLDSEEEEDDDDDLEVEEVDSDEWDEDEGDLRGEAIPPNVCLFSDHESKDVEGNLLHMTEKYSFFLPDPEYLVDLEGLLAYLGEKVILQYHLSAY